MKWWGSHYPCWVKAFQVWPVRGRSTQALVSNSSSMRCRKSYKCFGSPKMNFGEIIAWICFWCLRQMDGCCLRVPCEGILATCVFLCACVFGGQRMMSRVFSISLHLTFWNRVSHWTWMSSIWLGRLANGCKRSSHLHYPPFWGYRYNASFWEWGLGI